MIDDILPFYPNNTKSRTSLILDNVSTNGGLWAAFMEKAWAKLNGNYDYIIGGSGNEVF